MTFKFTLALSRIHPLIYLLGYLVAIPAFGILYATVTPHGFYAPYARYEPEANTDRDQLALALEKALQRSFDDRPREKLIVGSWKIDPNSLRVTNMTSSDGTQLSFRIRISAEGIGQMAGTRQYGWSIDVSVPETVTAVTPSGPNLTTTFRFIESDFSKYAPTSKQESEKLFMLIFVHDSDSVVQLEPVLALNWNEELQFKRYLQGIKGDASAISGHLERMIYLSAVVITTLGLGDIIPITSRARLLIAMEAVLGIVFAGLFLNALAYRASKSVP